MLANRNIIPISRPDQLQPTDKPDEFFAFYFARVGDYIGIAGKTFFVEQIFDQVTDDDAGLSPTCRIRIRKISDNEVALYATFQTYRHNLNRVMNAHDLEVLTSSIPPYAHTPIPPQ